MSENVKGPSFSDIGEQATPVPQPPEKALQPKARHEGRSPSFANALDAFESAPLMEEGRLVSATLPGKERITVATSFIIVMKSHCEGNMTMIPIADGVSNSMLRHDVSEVMHKSLGWWSRMAEHNIACKDYVVLSIDQKCVEYAIQSLGQSESPYGVRVRLEPTDLVSEPALTAAIFGSVQAYKNLPAVVPRCFLGSSGSATAPRVLVIGTQPNSAAEKRLLGGLVALAVTVGCIVGKVEGWKTAVDVLEILFVAVAFVHF